MHTLQQFLMSTKAVGYVVAVAFMLAFIVFWRFVSARYDRRMVLASAAFLGLAFCVMAVLWVSPPSAGKPAEPPTEVATPKDLSDELVVLAATHSPEEAPELLIIGELSDIYVPVVFAHRLHAEMAGGRAGCTICHHYGDTEQKMQPCKDCHGGPFHPTNMRQPGLKAAYHRQCVSCHREWSHETECSVCHAKRKPGNVMAQIRDSADIIGGNHVEIPTPTTVVYRTKSYTKGPVVTFFHDEHVNVFNLKCANCHREEGCGRCHEGVGKTHAPPPRTEEEVHRVCVECHGDDGCDKCHSTKEMKPSSGAGGGLQLASERLSEPIVFAQGPGSPAPVAFRHDTHGEYGLNCSNCHPWLYMMTREKTAPSRVHTAAASERHECSECHDGETAFDVQIDCRLCHREPNAQPRPPAARALPTVEYPPGGDSPGPVVFSHDTHVDPDTPTCSVCHPDPFTMLPMKADPDLDKRLPMMHEQAFCGRCHNGEAAFNWEDDCMMCHREREEEPVPHGAR